MAADLVYYIYEGILIGTAAGRHFHFAAVSGGGGGSTKHAPTSAMNNPYREGLKTRGPKGPAHVHGGALPPGRYDVLAPSQHPRLGLAAELRMTQGNGMGRSGFFLHGRGPHGSDGCIVPLQKADFLALMTALKASGGGRLSVVESMGDAGFA